MALNDEQRLEIDLFLKVAEQENPKDILQFSANYFNKRLEQQRQMSNNNSGTTSLSTSHNNSSTGLFKGSFSISNDPFDRPASPVDPKATFGTSTSTTAAASKLFKNSADPMDPTSEKLQVNEKIPMHFNALRRTSVSAETFQPDSIENWKPDHYSEKTGEQLKRLEKAVGNNFLFNKLDGESATLVINSLKEEKVNAGTEIIKQGDEGDYFYIVENGTVDFYVNGTKVNSSGPGSSFGELALMYNSPRAATVVATTPCILWALDRMTFRKILLGSSFKKRVMYDEFLKSVPILKGLSNYDRGKLADALDTEIYERDAVIIREGDHGENFYFIEYGACDVTKEKDGLVAKLNPHDYFGEVALLNDLPRQATVTATEKTKVATLGKAGFQRLLGPVREVLEFNDPTRH
ncbi:hypothetical protein TBLA_0D04800 [Henningerozyma blattae CBS 6284]|uniref:cAMP-dependent protein kinase regulatory subunit n=1 Tax=Henningerozyma blattae (strain ATCC 34711 / CBS 6284 / DSM 70876 / NBRC 10599 / NRRL Y-10934 / UCD 77-7) TaxID=1071380 RepID=I2H3M4_HENB6|nr:hypothetical protein TBLA_0D04800 [Tetrapisispora blattae CBS 6284]CCH60976.1 hypothetical protein TBLA_0D04800 [Tetrapisispora blattae CBS 6284]